MWPLHPNPNDKGLAGSLQAYTKEGHSVSAVYGKPNGEGPHRETSPGASGRPKVGGDQRKAVHGDHKPEVLRLLHVPAVRAAYLLLLPDNNKIHGRAVPAQAQIYYLANGGAP